MKYVESKDGLQPEKSPVTFLPIDEPFKAIEDSDDSIMAVTVVARRGGRWVLFRRGPLLPWEIPAGDRMADETPLEAAKRVLLNCTGASAIFTPIALYQAKKRGMLFFAEVSGSVEAGDQSREIRVQDMEILPKDLSDPEMIWAMYRRIQGWLNLQSSADERWDVYDENFQLTGRLHRRGDPMPDGDYHLVVGIWIQNSRGEFLNTRRSPNKGFPNLWENTGGSALAGDDSLSAALREVREETGFELDPEKGQCIMRIEGRDYFTDCWHFKQDFDLKDAVLQVGETCDVRWASRTQIEKDLKDGYFVPVEHLETLLDQMTGK